jgi:hypothetical protein
MSLLKSFTQSRTTRKLYRHKNTILHLSYYTCLNSSPYFLSSDADGLSRQVQDVPVLVVVPQASAAEPAHDDADVGSDNEGSLDGEQKAALDEVMDDMYDDHSSSDSESIDSMADQSSESEMDGENSVIGGRYQD